MEEVGSKHPDLIAHEFFLTHNLLKKSGNSCNFQSIEALARLEPQYNKVKGRSHIYIYIFLGVRRRIGAPGRVGQPARLPFSRHLGGYGDDNSFKPSATPEEVSQIEIVCARVEAHPNAFFSKGPLEEGNI